MTIFLYIKIDNINMSLLPGKLGFKSPPPFDITIYLKKFITKNIFYVKIT